jgi:hypothetical protein
MNDQRDFSVRAIHKNLFILSIRVSAETVGTAAVGAVAGSAPYCGSSVTKTMRLLAAQAPQPDKKICSTEPVQKR